MNQKTSIQVSAAVLLALAAFTGGCENADLTAPGDGTIVMTANPATVTIDPNDGQNQGQTTVVARVFDADGRPVENVSVIFSTTGGTLASGGSPGAPVTAIKTNAAGIAQDTLTLRATDPDAVEVTAQSSALSEKVTVTKVVVDEDELPRATIVDIPRGSQIVGEPVLFDGTASVDPQGRITCYKWKIDSTVDTEDRLIQGTAASAIETEFDVEQTLAVQLFVSDRTDAEALCSPTGSEVPDELFSPFSASILYLITCSNPPPVASAGPDQAATLLGTAATVTLNGTLSSDAQTGINRYVWDCGNGTAPLPASPDSSIVICKYNGIGTFVATLTVVDKGTGVINPANGSFFCEKSDDDTATVTVTLPQ